jgi:hypothetical protein
MFRLVPLYVYNVGGVEGRTSVGGDGEDEDERREGTGNPVDFKTGELERTNKEVLNREKVLGTQSWGMGNVRITSEPCENEKRTQGMESV